jgi:hypothetical protein
MDGRHASDFRGGLEDLNHPDNGCSLGLIVFPTQLGIYSHPRVIN